MQIRSAGVAARVRRMNRLESAPRQGGPMLQSGDHAPLFSLPDADMQMFDLAATLNTQHVVLYFYPRDNTPGCTLQAAEFSDHEDQFARHHCTIVGVSPDDCLTHADFRDLHGLSIRLLADEDNQVCRLYDVWQPREFDGVKKMGVLRSTFLIDRSGVIRHALYNVNPRGHAAQVFELVRRMDARIKNANC